MFGKRTTLAMTTIIGKDTSVSGDLNVSGSARIDGIVEGNVTITGDLIIGSTGKVNGDIKAQSIVIGGEVNGDVSAPDKAELTATAKMLGNLFTRAIVIDENAVFQGKCDMNQQMPEKNKKKKPVAKVTGTTKKSAKAALQEALLEVKGNGLNRETKPEEQQKKESDE